MNDWGEPDPDGPLDEDLLDDGERAVPCPACGRDVYEDVDQCVHCGHWIIPSPTSFHRRHWVWTLAALLAVSAMIIIAVS